MGREGGGSVVVGRNQAERRRSSRDTGGCRCRVTITGCFRPPDGGRADQQSPMYSTTRAAGHAAAATLPASARASRRPARGHRAWLVDAAPAWLGSPCLPWAAAPHCRHLHVLRRTAHQKGAPQAQDSETRPGASKWRRGMGRWEGDGWGQSGGSPTSRRCVQEGMSGRDVGLGCRLPNAARPLLV